MKPNFGFTFGRTPESQSQEYQELVKRLEEQAKTQTTTPDVQEPQPRESQTGKGDINGKWVYVPSINTSFAVERSNNNLDWTETHKPLIHQGLRMPTPRETWELIFYLKDNIGNPEHKRVYDDILKTTPAGTWHGEWQNAYFTQENGKFYIQNVTKINKKGELEFGNKKELTDYLNSDVWADTSSRANISDEGLCKSTSNLGTYAQGGNIYFRKPRDKSVARFSADSGRAYLNCCGVPSGRGASLGVRVCAEGTRKK